MLENGESESKTKHAKLEMSKKSFTHNTTITLKSRD